MGEDDNTNVTVLPDQVFVRAMTTGKAPPMRRIVSSGRRRGVGRALAQDHVRDRQEGMSKGRLKMALQVLFREQCDGSIRSEYQHL